MGQKGMCLDEENVALNIGLFISSSDSHLQKVKLNFNWQNNRDTSHWIGFAAENTKMHQKKFSLMCRLRAIRLQWFNCFGGRTLLSKSSRRKVFPQMGHWANQGCLWKRWGGGCRGLWIAGFKKFLLENIPLFSWGMGNSIKGKSKLNEIIMVFSFCPKRDGKMT